ncbi:MAG TPA: HU family DNA-binding protein, partial [Solirubrobacterales bacterium]|nr:HU family DNA-binding protein [Solirubrobacterales bacterium]
MTKSEFVDLVSRDDRIGSKKHAGEAVEAVLDGIESALARGDDVNFTG